MQTDTTFTVTGAGFELAVSYKCRLTTKEDSGAVCDSAGDCYSGSDAACSAGALCVNSRCSRSVSYETTVLPSSIFTIECPVNTTLWASCFAAEATLLSAARVEGGVETAVQFGGAAGAADVVLPEVLLSASPLIGNKFGFTTITVVGGGFDVTVKYACRFTLLTTVVDSFEVYPTSASTIQCISPNWASLSGLGGSGALTTMTLLKATGETVTPVAPISYNFI
ncbi:hypothetical protein T484DRAFT_3259325 [Baffinella frigidus]|nr:hypothetical protein T484DRAFT_3259325 [Cryptophyta sp. CCMP2293]